MTADVNGNDRIPFDHKIDAYPVGDVDGNGVEVREFSVQFVQPQGRMGGIQFQQFEGFFVLGQHLGVFFEELFGTLEITFSINDFSHE